ncbi:pirin family protein [Synechococcus sp. CBW1107]|uniref:pirin family protein n=1 Tax=Synechococcus sp. CBW1107 TaxID=2789857 RepID=UPI002AD1DA71|nr:pirin family protein [Synechococcus sp. CBW1107]CAK6695540.1 Quercetin 2,3-dioxygenase [Synechococcus sp. CBW1107]
MPAVPLETRPSPLLLCRRAGERFHSSFDWLESWHTFSFSHHFDPAWMGFGPLKVINDDTIAAGRGFGMHPHRDMEIITVMVQGELHHRDSMGHAEILRAGEVQRMSAGTGVVHSEFNGGSTPCRLLQIWIEPSRRGIPPAYEQKPFAIGAGWTLLLDPEGSGGAMAIERPVRLWRARPQPGDRLANPLESGTQGWIQMIEGSLEIAEAGAPLLAGDGLGFDAASIGAFRAGREPADVLLFELR